MNIFRTIAIILMAALANPFCCCLLGDASGSHADPVNPTMHGCCAAVQSADHSNADTHTPDDCPHQYEKESQISQSADSFHFSFTPSLDLTTALETMPWSVEQNTGIFRSKIFTENNPVQASVELYSQTYCVFRL